MNIKQTPTWYGEYKDFIEVSIDKYLDTYLALPMTPPLETYKEALKYAFHG